MKNIQIIFMVVGASLVSFILSVVFSMNMVSISPKNLAEVIKKDPETFMNAIQSSAEKLQKEKTEQAMEEQFKNPVKIPTKGRVVFGEASAPIAIVEYSDFQCGYCARASKNMKQIIKKYKGQVKLVYKHFPLDFHPFAKPAAEYFEAIALMDPKKARAFHDAIFDEFSNYARLKSEKEIKKSLKALADKVDVSEKDIKKHMEKAKKIVQDDLDEGARFNVRGTPTFFINGINPQGRFEMVIDKLLSEL